MSLLSPNIDLPLLNPLKLYNYDTERLFCDSIPSHFNEAYYFNPYNKTDYLNFQIKCEIAPHVDSVFVAGLYDENGYLKYSVSILPLYANLGGWNYFECRKQLTAIAEGYYQLRVNVKNVSSTGVLRSEYNLRSEPIHVAETHEDTRLIKFSHKDNSKGMFFVNPVSGVKFYYQLRIYGGFEPTDVQPSSKDSFYRDQPNNLKLLNSIAYEVYKFTIGDSEGVPNYLIFIFNRILSCSYVMYDGVAWIKSESAKLEAFKEKNFPKIGWKVDLESPDNLSSTTYSLPKIKIVNVSILTNVLISSVFNGAVIGSMTYYTGQVVAFLGQTTASQKGIYVVGENSGDTLRDAEFPDAESLDNTILYAEVPDSNGDYILTLYYDTVNSEIMTAPTTQYSDSDTGVRTMTGETLDIVFNVILQGIPTNIILECWDADGEEVSIGYDPATVSIQGMRVEVQGNTEELKVVYKVNYAL